MGKIIGMILEPATLRYSHDRRQANDNSEEQKALL